MDHGSLARRIDALLPQTQCTRCGYPGCLPYAEAVARGDADFDRCPPGGQEGIDALANLLGRASKELDPAVGPAASLRVARIDEEACIGCTLCIQACPVDAIVGAAKRMHTVVPAWCSGCDLCVAPCPVDCIVMIDAGRRWTSDDARDARTRFEARSARANGGDGTSRGTPTELRTGQSGAGEAPRLAAVAAALERARARRRAASGAR